MPDSRIMAATGERPKVRGRSSAIAAGGPKPGNTPVKVPNKTPKKQNRIFAGWKAMPNP